MISIKKTKITTIILMALFFGMVFCSIPDGPLTNFAEDPQTNESQDIFTAPKPTDDSIIDTPATRSVIDFNQVYNSESIKTDIEFNAETIDFYNPIYEFWTLTGGTASFLGANTYIASHWNIWTDNSQYTLINSQLDTAISMTETHGFHASFKLYCGGSGTLNYEFYAKFFYSPTGYVSTNTLTNTAVFESSDLDSQGYIQLGLNVYIDPVTDELDIAIRKITTSGSNVFDSNTKTSVTQSNLMAFEFNIDYLYFQRTTIVNHIRSEIQYSGPTVKTISIDIPSVPHAKEIRVYTDLDYSSITPTATVTRVSDYWKIASPVEITYKMLFLSTCQNHLAIKEVSTSFLTDISFETGQYTNDWLVDYGNLNLNTQVSFDGFSSLDVGGVVDFFEDSGDACDFEVDVEEFDIKLNGLDTIDRFEQYGEWKLRLYEAGGGTNLGARRDNLAINTDDYTLFTTEIYTSGTSVDRVKITLHFSDASTQDYTELIPAYTMEEFSFDITAGKTIDKIDIYFGDSGWYSAAGDRIYVSYIEIKQLGSEITLTLPENDYYLSYSVYLQTGTMVLTTDDQTVTNDGSVIDRWITEFIFTHTDTVTLTTTLADVDLTNFFDNFRIFQTSTTIETFGYSESMIESTLISWDGYKNPLLEGQQTLNTTLLERSSQTSIYSTNLTSTTGIFELLYDQALEQKEYEIWTYSYSSGEFNNCSFYFTPSYPTHTDYAETVLNDAWDFSEGDTEGWSPYSSTSDSVENGYWEKISDTAYSKYYIQNIDAFDETYYTVIVFGIWSNVSQTISFQQKTGGIWGTVRRQTNHDLTANTWTIITVVGITTYDIDCFVINTDINVTPKKVKLDYVELVHVDSWLEETNDYATDQLLDAWDFEEYDSGTILDGWQESVGGQTIEIENGCFKVDITSTDAYTRLVATGLSISASTYTRIEITIKTNEDSLQLYFAESDNQAITAKTEIGVANVFHKLIFDIDDTDWSGTETALYLWLYDSSGNFEADEFFWIEEIRLIHLEEMPYTTIQNSVLLESETNDLQYNLYLDHNLIGTFSDLSLIPIPQTAGTHYLSVQPFRTDEAYSTQQIFSYYYTVEATAFSVSVENFYLSDLYVSTYVTSNYNGIYYVYTNNDPDGSGTLSAIGTTISTSRDLSVGVTINYAIKFVNSSDIIWFNTTYSNPHQDFFITDYRINTTAPDIIITWDTSKNTIDSLTAIEDGVEKATDDPTSTTSWTKSTEAGTHYVTLIFSATDYEDIIFSFTYTVAAIEEFQIDIENVYPSDDYLNIYCTSNYDYSYTAYTNGSVTGTGNGLSVGTFIIIPKLQDAGIFNLTVAFDYGAETVLFMTWYSNLIPPPEPITDIYREQSEGYFNITLMTNLDTFWVDIYHDGVLIIDDSTLTEFAILKDTKIGYHFVQLVLIYNCSTDADGYPVAEYNQTVTYPVFYYETVLFYDCQIRYTERIYGIAIPEIDVDSVLTYLDGVLVDTLNYTSVIQDHSNYSYILNNRLWIHNSARNHRLVVRDLFDNLIYNTTIDIGIIQSMTIELPLEKIYVINLDDDDRMIKIRPYLGGLDWDADSDNLITMILGQYEQKSYWLIDSTYECRIYKKVETVSDGVTLWYWVHDPDVEPPPDRVPFSITIPLEIDEDDDGTATWWDKVVNFFKQYWFYIAAVLLIIILLISYNVIGNAIVKKQEEQIRSNKKVGLMVQTLVQLLWANKYERLKGYERGKKK